MADNSPILALPLVRSSQTQKEVTVNEALLLLEAVAQITVKSATQSPSSPVAGDRYIVPTGSAYAGWTGFAAGSVALCVEGGAWRKIVPLAGWKAYVQDTAVDMAYAGGVWSIVPAPTAKLSFSTSGTVRAVTAAEFAKNAVFAINAATSGSFTIASGAGVRHVVVTGAGTATIGSVVLSAGYHVLHLDGAGVATKLN